MNRIAFRKIRFSLVLCIAAMLFVFNTPMTSHGDDCGYEITVNVAANIINITSQGEGHAVVVHTNQDWFELIEENYDTLGLTEVFVNDGDIVNDCIIGSFGQREDDNGHLDIYFPLDELIKCEKDLDIGSEDNILRVEGDPE